MATLYTVNKSPYARTSLASCLRIARDGSALLLNGFFAVAEFGWNSLIYGAPIMAAVSVYGTALIMGVMWLCLWWLRSCGWVCVNRRATAGEKPRSATSAAAL